MKWVGRCSWNTGCVGCRWWCINMQVQNQWSDEETNCPLCHLYFPRLSWVFWPPFLLSWPLSDFHIWAVLLSYLSAQTSEIAPYSIPCLASFYPFDLFEGPLIIPIGCAGLQNSGSTSSAGTELLVDPVSMWIEIFPYNFLGRAVKLVKMSGFEFFKIKLDTILEIIVFIVSGCILIKLVYRVLVDHVMVSCLKVKPLSKEDF